MFHSKGEIKPSTANDFPDPVFKNLVANASSGNRLTYSRLYGGGIRRAIDSYEMKKVRLGSADLDIILWAKMASNDFAESYTAVSNIDWLRMAYFTKRNEFTIQD